MTIIIKKVEKNLGKISLLIVYSIIVFWFLVSGEGTLTGWNSAWTFNAIIYVLGVTLFLGAIDELPRELKTSAGKNLKYFAIASILTLTILLVVRDLGLMFQNISPMPYHLIPANMVYHGVIVATPEEIIFRGVIFGFLYDHFKLRPERQTGELQKYGWIIPYFGSALIFAFFHYAVYGLNLVSLGMIFVMGLVFAYAVERWGLGASIGVHWIWNCMAIGIFVLPRELLAW